MRPQMLNLIAWMALVTYLTRLSFLVLPDWLRVPRMVGKALKYVPVGILTALVVTGVTQSLGFFLGGLLSGLVAYRSGNVLLAMASGMTLVALLHWAAGV